MIYQQWSYPIPLTIYPSNQLSSPSPTPLYNPFYLFLPTLCLLSSPILKPHVFSSIYYNSKYRPLSVLTTNENFRKVFTIKTNLLCNPTMVTMRSKKPFIHFYYHYFHYSFAKHLPFLYVYIYLSPFNGFLLLTCNFLIILRLHLNKCHKSFLFLYISHVYLQPSLLLLSPLPFPFPFTPHFIIKKSKCLSQKRQPIREREPNFEQNK